MPSRWLRIWANVTVAGTIVLLALGTIVSSFKVGMADPIWPTEPWRLALIDWSEPSGGFLIEHTHRLAGFTVGGLISVLTLGIWWSEPSRNLRWGGTIALLGLIAAFGYLHGDLIAQAKRQAPGLPLSASPTSTSLLVLALAAVLFAAIVNAYRQSSGWGLRLLGVAVLIGVMIQGLMGGLRVHLDVMLGKSMAVIHASFSQVVFGLTVIIAILCRDHRRCMVLDRDTLPRAWSLIALVTVYFQIVAGGVLRHTALGIGPRLHLLLGFVGVIAILAMCTRFWRLNMARAWVIGTLTLVTMQLVLGVESWLVRFSDGLAASEFRRITAADALLRATHALVGYLTFACIVVLAIRANRVVSSEQSLSKRQVMEAVA